MNCIILTVSAESQCEISPNYEKLASWKADAHILMNHLLSFVESNYLQWYNWMSFVFCCHVWNILFSQYKLYLRKFLPNCHENWLIGKLMLASFWITYWLLAESNYMQWYNKWVLCSVVMSEMYCSHNISYNSVSFCKISIKLDYFDSWHLSHFESSADCMPISIIGNDTINEFFGLL